MSSGREVFLRIAAKVLDDLCRHPEAACFVVPSPAAHGQVPTLSDVRARLAVDGYQSTSQFKLHMRQVLQDPSFGEQRAAVGARVYAHFDAMLGARIEQAIRLKQAAMLQARQASQPPGQTTLQPVLAQHAAQSSAAASGADLAPSPTYPPAGPAVPNYPPSSSPCDLQNHAGQLSSGAGPAPLSTSPSESAPAQLGSSRQFLDNTASVYHSSISAPDASLHVDHASDSRPSRADMGQASDPTYKRTREDSPAGSGRNQRVRSLSHLYAEHAAEQPAAAAAGGAATGEETAGALDITRNQSADQSTAAVPAAPQPQASQLPGTTSDPAELQADAAGSLRAPQQQQLQHREEPQPSGSLMGSQSNAQAQAGGQDALSPDSNILVFPGKKACVVCRRAKKGRCGTATSAIRCDNRRLNGLPYIDSVTGDHVGIDPSDLTAGGAYIYNRSKNGSQRTIVQKQTEAQRLAAAAGAARPSAAHGAAASQHGLLELSQSTQPHATAVSHSEGGSPMAHPPVDTHETTAAAAAAAAAPGGMVAPPPPPLTASGEGNAVPPAAVATRRQRRPAAQRTLDGAAATGAMGDGAAAAGQEAGCGGGSGEGEDKAALLLELEDVQAQINEKMRQNKAQKRRLARQRQAKEAEIAKLKAQLEALTGQPVTLTTNAAAPAVPAAPGGMTAGAGEENEVASVCTATGTAAQPGAPAILAPPPPALPAASRQAGAGAKGGKAGGTQGSAKTSAGVQKKGVAGKAQAAQKKSAAGGSNTPSRKSSQTVQPALNNNNSGSAAPAARQHAAGGAQGAAAGVQGEGQGHSGSAAGGSHVSPGGAWSSGGGAQGGQGGQGGTAQGSGASLRPTLHTGTGCSDEGVVDSKEGTAAAAAPAPAAAAAPAPAPAPYHHVGQHSWPGQTPAQVQAMAAQQAMAGAAGMMPGMPWGMPFGGMPLPGAMPMSSSFFSASQVPAVWQQQQLGAANPMFGSAPNLAGMGGAQPHGLHGSSQHLYGMGGMAQGSSGNLRQEALAAAAAKANAGGGRGALHMGGSFPGATAGTAGAAGATAGGYSSGAAGAVKAESTTAPAGGPTATGGTAGLAGTVGGTAGRTVVLPEDDYLNDDAFAVLEDMIKNEGGGDDEPDMLWAQVECGGSDGGHGMLLPPPSPF